MLSNTEHGVTDIEIPTSRASHHLDVRYAPQAQRVRYLTSFLPSEGGLTTGASPSSKQAPVAYGGRNQAAYAPPVNGPIHPETAVEPRDANEDDDQVPSTPGDYGPEDDQQLEVSKSGPIEEAVHPNGASEHDVDDDMDVDVISPPHIKRVSKKRMADDEEDDEADGQLRVTRRDKRARKVSREGQPEALEVKDDEGMDIEEAADDAVPRGKKRERGEAGSTYGGDDSGAEEEERSRRHRKRRTVAHRVAAASRGQKRGRGIDVESDEETDRPLSKSARKGRSKRDADEHEDVSQDPLCKGRRIGEEWESNGIHYKVGPNGQRLRQELVKKSRSKFPMVS